jgi:hypothetical protein
LEALQDLLGKYGAAMVADHEKILKVVQPQLTSKRTTSRKRAINCLGNNLTSPNPYIPQDIFLLPSQTIYLLILSMH